MSSQTTKPYTDILGITITAMNDSTTNVSISALLADVQSSQREIFIYPFVTVIFCMIIGFIGNTVVIYIFTMQWKLTKTTVFILTLAGVDLMSCVINMPTEAAILWNPSDFDHHVICRISRYTTFIASASSSFVLIAISIDRYLMICRPFLGRELGVLYAKRTCLVAVLLGVFTTWPSLIIYGTYTYDVEPMHGGQSYNNGTSFVGKTCLITNYYVENYRLPAGFYFFLFGGHVIMFLILTLIYSLIGRSLFMSTDPNVSDEKRHSLKYLGISLASAIIGSVPNTPTETHKVFGGRVSRPGSRAMSIENINRLEINPVCLAQTMSTPPVNRPSRENNVSINVIDDSDVNHNNDDVMKREEELFEALTRAPLASAELSDLNETQIKPTVKQNGVGVEVERRHKPADKSACHLSLNTRNERPNGRLSSESTASDRSLIPLTPISPDSVRGILYRSQSVESRARLNRIISDELRQTDLNRSSLRRNTLMLRMVTIAFIVSFLPYLIIVTIRYSNPDIPTKLNKLEQIFYHVFLRTYFVNSMINPFIYGFMNEEFRLKLKNLFCSFCTRHHIRLGI